MRKLLFPLLFFAGIASAQERIPVIFDTDFVMPPADDGLATDSAIELVWDAAVSQAQRALNEATNALTQAQSAACASACCCTWLTSSASRCGSTTNLSKAK